MWSPLETLRGGGDKEGYKPTTRTYNPCQEWRYFGVEICDNGANTTRGQSPNHSLHHSQQNNKRGTVQPFALFLITPHYDTLTESNPLKQWSEEPLLVKCDRIVGAPPKAQRREERKQGVACSGLFGDCSRLAKPGEVQRFALRLGSRRRSGKSPHLWALPVIIAPVGSVATDEAEARRRRRSVCTGFFCFSKKKGSPLLY